VKLYLTAEFQLAPLTAFIISVPPAGIIKADVRSPEYSPPLLYVLHERFLI